MSCALFEASVVTRLLLNSLAGHGGARRLTEILKAYPDLELIEPTGPEAVYREALRAVEDGDERLLVAGGDGTLHHAIRGLAGSDCALGILPLGSGNDFARALGVPVDLRSALARALQATPRRVDLGRVDGKPFAGIAGIGFDGEAARCARERVRIVRGRWIYPYAVARTLLTFRPPHVSIASDDGNYAGRVMLVALANSPFYGGGMLMAPRAELDDGQLDLVVVEQVSRLRFLALFPRVYRGAHVGLAQVRTFRLRQATVHADRELTFFADGEPLAPCAGSRIDVWPAALSVV